MNLGTKLNVLAIAPTRQGDHSDRVPDKHSRLFHGKTLDEWFMIRMWASKYVNHYCLVTETEPYDYGMAHKWGCKILPRPEEMNHPLEDSGAFPMVYGHTRYPELFDPPLHINIVLENFVISPLLMPYDIDRAIEQFINTIGNPDGWFYPATMRSCARTDSAILRQEENSPVAEIVQVADARACFTTKWNIYSTLSVLNISTYAYRYAMGVLGPAGVAPANPCIPYVLEEWQECHIDYEDQWKHAEFWFGEKGLCEEAYSEYRRTWENPS